MDFQYRKHRGLNLVFATLAMISYSSFVFAEAPKDIQAYIDGEFAYNDICRDFPSDDPAAAKACERRDRLVAELQKRGWCWGPQDKPGAVKKWQPCNGASEKENPPPTPANAGLALGSQGKFSRQSMACPETLWLDVFERKVNIADLAHDQNGRLEAITSVDQYGCGPVPVGTIGQIVDIEKGSVGLVYYRMRFKSGSAYWVNSANVVPATQ